MKLKLASSFLFLLFLSCSVDYDLEPSLVNEPDRIIVDSYLSPDCPLQVQLFESVKTESGYVNRGLTQAHVIVKEDQTTLFDGICTDSILRLDYQPHENAAYSIEVSHEGLATVSAQTCIPKAIHCNASFSTDGKYWDTSRYPCPPASVRCAAEGAGMSVDYSLSTSKRQSARAIQRNLYKPFDD